ncbi:MAG: FAD-dependent monooxygenase [Verrucomicrobiales bacterium]|nr:FAD-dependent monooxygenase [Verrucomicrobiales bacterium]
MDTLVVGAGPVGLLAALHLRRSGISVEIVDQAWRSAAQSYACGLHSESIELLASMGLEEGLMEAGVRVDTVAFYEGTERKAELKLGHAGGRYPFLLVVPQDRLEELLEDALRNLGLRVHWGHRLNDLRTGPGSVAATIDRLALTSVGYPFARSEEMVQATSEVEASYVIGADGAESHVRQVLGISMVDHGAEATYDVVEFDCLNPNPREVRVGISPGTADVYWPQQGSVCRWSLELLGGAVAVPERPAKERRAFVMLDDEPDAQAREALTRDLKKRAPWFVSGIREIDWRTTVTFPQRSAASFGRGRVWLAGDAGHQTGPIGMQSMNVGLREALDLSSRIVRILSEGANSGLLDDYGISRREEWSFLLGGAASTTVMPTADAWVKAQRKRILGWIPGSGPALTAYLAQLGLGSTAVSRSEVPSLA